LLEVERLAEHFQLERLAPMATTELDISEVFLAVPQPAAAGNKAGKTLQVRAVSHSRLGFDPKENTGWAAHLERLMLSAVHELECATLNPKAAGAESRLMLTLTSLVDMPASDLYTLLETFTAEFAARHGALLQKLWVDEMTTKVRLGSDSEGTRAMLRFTASCSAGEYMKCIGLMEQADPVSGVPACWYDIASGQKQQFPDAEPDVRLRAKRAAARRAGSTYAPEFLGLLEAALVKEWVDFNRGRTEEQGYRAPPKELLKAVELLPGASALQEAEARKPGTNDIGMLAWRCFMRTPQFPEGRSMILIANDVTHQAGSFGVAEECARPPCTCPR